MFLQNGFDDFISKPIDVRQLDAILNKLIRDMQPPEVIEAVKNRAKPNDEQPGEPQLVIDSQLDEIFTRDALKVLAALEAVSKKNDYSNEVNLRTFIINVHGIKSALANIGRNDLSAMAFKLETAGRNADLGTIISETSVFLKLLREIVEEIMAKYKTIADEEVDEDKQYLREKMLAIKAACEGFDENAADELLAELRKQTWSKETGEILSKIAEHLLHSDFIEITEIIGKLTEKGP
jgi:HPt (histidine-containing phosphotransfer) domain-containing protein